MLEGSQGWGLGTLVPRQPKALELFVQERDIGCCRSDKEAGLVSKWTVLARQGCEHLLVDVEGGQSSHMSHAVCILTHMCILRSRGGCST